MAKSPESSHPTGGRRLQVVVVSPEATVLQSEADFVALPLLDGEMGIAPLHSPLIGRLGFGEMRIVDGGQTRRFYIDGGFVQVVNDVVSVLTSKATPAEAIDMKATADQLAVARTRTATTDETIAAREKAQMQARAMLRVAERAGSR